MYVVSRAGASKAVPTYGALNSMTAEGARRQMDDAERADTALNLNLVLGDGSRDSPDGNQPDGCSSATGDTGSPCHSNFAAALTRNAGPCRAGGKGGVYILTISCAERDA